VNLLKEMFWINVVIFYALSLTNILYWLKNLLWYWPQISIHTYSWCI